MYYRYSFTFPPKADYPDHPDWTGDLDKKVFWKLKCIVSDPDSPENSVSFKRHTFNFIKYFSGIEGLPPHPLLDLWPENVKFIGREPAVVSAMRLECLVENREKLLYRLQVGHTAEEYELFVLDAVRRCECIRRHFVSINDIASFLL